MTNLPPEFSRFDRDPEALAWARGKVQDYIDRLADFERQVAEAGDEASVRCFRIVQSHVRSYFLGDGGCVIGVFDQRMPDLAKAIDSALPAPVDRAVKRDHSLCGVTPCSDCR